MKFMDFDRLYNSMHLTVVLLSQLLSTEYKNIFCLNAKQSD